MIERWLLSRLEEGRIYNFKRIGASLDLLLSDCSVKVNKMAEAACLGLRQFERVFFESVGMKPKEYAGIARFQKSLSLMQDGGLNHTDVSYLSGYSDQSHFIRECRKYSGLTPSELTARHKVYSDLFSSPF